MEVLSVILTGIIAGIIILVCVSSLKKTNPTPIATLLILIGLGGIVFSLIESTFR